MRLSAVSGLTLQAPQSFGIPSRKAATPTGTTIRSVAATANNNNSNHDNNAISKSFLLQQAENVRRTLVPVSTSEHNGIGRSNDRITVEKNNRADQILSQYSSTKSLFHPTFYSNSQRRYIPKTMKKRGFSNWLVPNRIMVGQYPGQTPEINGPSISYVTKHIESLLSTPSTTEISPSGLSSNDICLFCSLQSEIPPQDDYKSWIEKNGGKVYLPKDGGGKEFPNYFGHYEPIVKKAFQMRQKVSKDEEPPKFLHAPILDLGTPSSTSLYATLSTLLQTLEDKPNSAIYIHCWGGRGRAGLVGACLLALLFPELDSNQILNWVQRGYDSRLGAENMPLGLRQSPQTHAQRDFVRRFVEDIRSVEEI